MQKNCIDSRFNFDYNLKRRWNAKNLLRSRLKWSGGMKNDRAGKRSQETEQAVWQKPCGVGSRLFTNVITLDDLFAEWNVIYDTRDKAMWALSYTGSICLSVCFQFRTIRPSDLQLPYPFSNGCIPAERSKAEGGRDHWHPPWKRTDWWKETQNPSCESPAEA